MKFENSFLGSFDPFHISHLHTRKSAENEIGPTQIVVCQNDLKEEGWLSTQQRRLDIIYTLLLSNGFDHQKRDPEQIVKIANNKEDILHYIINSKHIVRGVRSSADLTYIQRLLNFYGIEDAENKGHLISVPQDLQNISSTANKMILQSFLKNFDDVPYLYRKMFSNSVYKKLKESKFPWNNRDIAGIKPQIEENIKDYFKRLEKL